MTDVAKVLGHSSRREWQERRLENLRNCWVLMLCSGPNSQGHLSVNLCGACDTVGAGGQLEVAGVALALDLSENRPLKSSPASLVKENPW